MECYAFFGSKSAIQRTFPQKKHNRSHKRAGRFSLPNVFFVARPKKHAEKLSYFFESALESARRPSFSSSREGGFFGRQKCRVTSDDEVNSSLEESGVFLRKGSKWDSDKRWVFSKDLLRGFEKIFK